MKSDRSEHRKDLQSGSAVIERTHLPLSSSPQWPLSCAARTNDSGPLHALVLCSSPLVFNHIPSEDAYGYHTVEDVATLLRS